MATSTSRTVLNTVLLASTAVALIGIGYMYYTSRKGNKNGSDAQRQQISRASTDEQDISEAVKLPGVSDATVAKSVDTNPTIASPLVAAVDRSSTRDEPGITAEPLSPDSTINTVTPSPMTPAIIVSEDGECGMDLEAPPLTSSIEEVTPFLMGGLSPKAASKLRKYDSVALSHKRLDGTARFATDDDTAEGPVSNPSTTSTTTPVDTDYIVDKALERKRSSKGVMVVTPSEEKVAELIAIDAAEAPEAFRVGQVRKLRKQDSILLSHERMDGSLKSRGGLETSLSGIAEDNIVDPDYLLEKKAQRDHSKGVVVVSPDEELIGLDLKTPASPTATSVTFKHEPLSIDSVRVYRSKSKERREDTSSATTLVDTDYIVGKSLERTHSAKGVMVVAPSEEKVAELIAIDAAETPEPFLLAGARKLRKQDSISLSHERIDGSLKTRGGLETSLSGIAEDDIVDPDYLLEKKAQRDHFKGVVVVSPDEELIGIDLRTPPSSAESSPAINRSPRKIDSLRLRSKSSEKREDGAHAPVDTDYIVGKSLERKRSSKGVMVVTPSEEKVAELIAIDAAEAPEPFIMSQARKLRDEVRSHHDGDIIYSEAEIMDSLTSPISSTPLAITSPRITNSRHSKSERGTKGEYAMDTIDTIDTEYIVDKARERSFSKGSKGVMVVAPSEEKVAELIVSDAVDKPFLVGGTKKLRKQDSISLSHHRLDAAHKGAAAATHDALASISDDTEVDEDIKVKVNAHRRMPSEKAVLIVTPREEKAVKEVALETTFLSPVYMETAHASMSKLVSPFCSGGDFSVISKARPAHTAPTSVKQSLSFGSELSSLAVGVGSAHELMGQHISSRPSSAPPVQSSQLGSRKDTVFIEAEEEEDVPIVHNKMTRKDSLEFNHKHVDRMHELKDASDHLDVAHVEDATRRMSHGHSDECFDHVLTVTPEEEAAAKAELLHAVLTGAADSSLNGAGQAGMEDDEVNLKALARSDSRQINHRRLDLDEARHAEKDHLEEEYVNEATERLEHHVDKVHTHCLPVTPEELAAAKGNVLHHELMGSVTGVSDELLVVPKLLRKDSKELAKSRRESFASDVSKNGEDDELYIETRTKARSHHVPAVMVVTPAEGLELVNGDLDLKEHRKIKADDTRVASSSTGISSSITTSPIPKKAASTAVSPTLLDSPTKSGAVSESEKLGDAAFLARNFDTAVAEYTKAVNMPGASALSPYMKRAAVLIKLGRFEEAERDCTGVLAFEPSNVKALLRRASVRKELGLVEESRRDFRAVLVLDPKNDVASKEVKVTPASISPPRGKKTT